MLMKIENAISNIDNSFFYYDENSVPNLSKLIALYTEITNVFRQELYGDNSKERLIAFDFENLKKVLYRKRISVIKPTTFDGLLMELQNHSKILHASGKTGITIVYDLNSELINSLKVLHMFMINVISEVSEEIEFAFEINTQIINDEKYCGIPWIKLYYNETYFAFYGLSEVKKLMIGRMLPELKQVASLEIYEIDSLDKFKIQIMEEYKKTLKNIEPKKNIK